MCDEQIKIFYQEVEQSLEGDYKIILEPNRELKEEWIEYDQVKWELDSNLQNLVNELLKEDTLRFEDKVLTIYEYICLNYIYDDNVLFFFKRDLSDVNNIKYIAVDWYGRIIEENWKENRKKHNRRVCYEFARFFAKAINELLKESDKFEAFMLGDKENLHYVVGLTGYEYSVILDVDNFNQLKDLARLKLGLTIDGIKILRDESEIFQKALDKFNQDKKSELQEVEEAKQTVRTKNTIDYFNRIIQILKEYSIDAEGFCEYMRLIIEQEDIEIEKIWKRVEDAPEKRYTRCLIFDFNAKNYLLDSINKTLNVVEKENLDKQIFIENPEENEYTYLGG